ncbi:sigma-70 family RNA polymerase sigma factor [Alteromonas sp. 5E99-2]|uniref:RNA polymerase sigma factor n=1 Tax=Alteromonas sp. 5E99-2 TaxID=2817683 RepID=UPI001A9805D5|nr:sigma-70 family RNA polymerase sigma factor [Alteromonas sp. 5E99-2]MBO1254829.1 sigma-70 family RNA polymerase sigma factor [Alteromonas sp. 5E99-2]
MTAYNINYGDIAVYPMYVWEGDLPKVRKFISSKISDKQDVDDLVQETVLRTIKSRGENAPLNSLAYQLQVAKTVIYDYWEGSAATNNSYDNDDLDSQIEITHTPDEQFIHSAKLRELFSVVEQMPKLRQEVFTLRRINEMSREQIASKLGISIDAVKKHINRATADLALHMQQQGWNEKE